MGIKLSLPSFKIEELQLLKKRNFLGKMYMVCGIVGHSSINHGLYLMSKRKLILTRSMNKNKDGTCSNTYQLGKKILVSSIKLVGHL